MENEIEMETAQVREIEGNPWDAVGSGYVKLEKDKAKLLLLIDWKIHWIKKFRDEKTKELKEQLEFSATVLSEDGKPCKKVFTTTSVGALTGLKEVFMKYYPDNSTPHLVRIKKIGEGKSTVYDVEEQPLAK